MSAMSAEINIGRVIQHLPEIRDILYENRRVIVIPLVGVAIYYSFRNKIKDGLDKWFHYVYVSYFLKDITETMRPFREEVLSELQEMKPVASTSSAGSGLKIVEIGMGPGESLPYYPKGSMITAVEPNPYFVRMLHDKQTSHPDLVAVLKTGAEDLSHIADESVDVVVSYLVLCSVSNPWKVLSEVKRVLAKGGRFYFFEHEQCRYSWKRYILQHVLNPLWALCFDGCRINRNTTKIIQENAFSAEKIKRELLIQTYPVAPVTRGYVTK